MKPLIEIIPYLLISLIWHPDHPGEFQIERRQGIYSSLEACEADGIEYVESHTINSLEYGGAQFAYKCLPVPSREEFIEMFGELQRQHELEREGQEQDSEK